MKVTIKGKISEQGRLEDTIQEIVSSMGNRFGIPDNTEIAIQDIEFKVIFKIDGEEKYATVPREIDGETVDEIFMLNVYLDENENIITEEDNEDESFYDGYTMATALGKEYKYSGIESKYQNDELEVVESFGENSPTGVMSVRYKVKNSPEIQLIRYYKGDLLVSEYELTPKEVGTIEIDD